MLIVQGSQDQRVKMAETEKFASTGSPHLVQLVWQPFTADGHLLESLSANRLGELVRTAFLMKELQHQCERQMGGGKEFVFLPEDSAPPPKVRRRKQQDGGAGSLVPPRASAWLSWRGWNLMGARAVGTTALGSLLAGPRQGRRRGLLGPAWSARGCRGGGGG